MIVYVSIGNSDDKLTQEQWATFVNAVQETIDNALRYAGDGSSIHGRWLSEPASKYQNACWCIEFMDALCPEIPPLRNWLRNLARIYNQDSIAWAEAIKVEFLEAREMKEWPL